MWSARRRASLRFETARTVLFERSDSRSQRIFSVSTSRPLDHFTRRVLVVKRHVKVKGVTGQIGTQGVCGGPGDPPACVCGKKVDDLL